MMTIKKFHIYLANLNPPFGTEPGKIRPVVVVQTDLLNLVCGSTIICPITTKVKRELTIFRVYLSKDETDIKEDSDILVDQIRAIDNRRFIKEVGKLNAKHQEKLVENLKVVLFE